MRHGTTTSFLNYSQACFLLSTLIPSVETLLMRSMTNAVKAALALLIRNDLHLSMDVRPLNSTLDVCPQFYLPCHLNASVALRQVKYQGTWICSKSEAT